MRYLLDTNVVSALRIRGRNPEVESWSRSVSLESQFICAPTAAEIERGVAAMERSDTEQGRVLRIWFENQLLPAFAGRILPFDLPAARVLGSMRISEHALLDDALIAAIAMANHMTIITRDTKHFEPLEGVDFLNPWELE